MKRFRIEQALRIVAATLRRLRAPIDLDFVRSSFPLGRRKMARSRNSSKSTASAADRQERPPLAGADRGGKPRLVVSRRTAGPGRRIASAARPVEPPSLANVMADVDDEDDSPYERPLVPMVREVKAPRRSSCG